MRAFRNIIVLLAFLLPSIALAAPATYTLLAPLGPLSGAVTLGDYLQGIVQVIIGVAGVLAVVMVVICAIQMMGSPSVSQKSASKECIASAIFGLLLAVGSWVILNTINADLLRNDGQLLAISAPPAVTTGAASEPPVPTEPGCYFKYKDVAPGGSGKIQYSRSATCPPCTQLHTAAQADKTNYEVLSACFEVKSGAAAPPAVPPSTPPPATTAGSVTCTQSGLNLCQPQYQKCANSKCPQFASLASSNASGQASAEMIKEIIFQESSCGINLVGDAGNSCGPTHIKVGTANMYKSACGVTDTITCGWLSNEANWDKAICMSVKYLNAIAASSCGSTPRNMIAGYNGGIGACAASANCASDTSCSGEPVKRWECLYDDDAHQQCNVRYTSLRNYATKALYCIANPGY